METSTIVLIITGIISVIAFALILSGLIINQQPSGNTGNTGNTGPTGLVCVGPGFIPKLDPLPYSRTVPKSICSAAISSNIPSFSTVEHPVKKSYRMRATNGISSPNYWLGNAMYGNNNMFLLYPYFGNIQDDGFKFGWPNSGILKKRCLLNITPQGCPSGYANLFFDSDWDKTIKISSFSETPMSCDIQDTDALVSTVAWQYQNSTNNQNGFIISYLAKGSPYITFQITNMGFSLSLDFQYTFSMIDDKTYLLNIDSKTGYLIVLNSSVTKLKEDVLQNLIFCEYTTQTYIRIAYFDSLETLSILKLYRNVYPILSTISTNFSNDNSTITTETTFEWTTGFLNPDLNTVDLLMLSIPNQNIVNNDVVNLFNINHPLIGPSTFVLSKTSSNLKSWVLEDKIPNLQFIYTPPSNTQPLIEVYNNESSYIFNNPPVDTVNWMKWLGSISILLLTINSVGLSIEKGLNVLKTQLDLIRINNGVMNINNTIVYDKTWSGVISKLGLGNCLGEIDNGNSFYNLNLNQYGYLVFAYAVAGYFDPNFIKTNKETSLFFARNIANPYEFDNSFPLWRNKDWFFGYSLSSGLSPLQNGVKNTTHIGEAVLGYYGCYLLSLVIENQIELQKWSLAMLSLEINALQYYYQLIPQNSVDFNQEFVQRTISHRSDTNYSYTTFQGNLEFPARNASIISELVNPLTLMSEFYISDTWAIFLQPFLSDAISAYPKINLDSYAYALYLLSIQNPDTTNIIQSIKDNSTNMLGYGSSWTSIMYNVLIQ
jgi:endoglucanase Acf2